MNCPRLILWIAIAALGLSCGAQPPHPPKSIGIEAHPNVRDLYQFAETQRAKHKWPALGVGIIHRGAVVGLGMAGERKINSGNWVTLNDLFDVGSCAKSLTGMLAALMVEEGKLTWKTTVREAFGSDADGMLPVYHGVTLQDLLTHRAGLDRWMSTNDRWSAWSRDHARLSLTEQRLAFAKAALARPPLHPPRSQYYYCNDGYLMAGAMIERAAGQQFEELMQERLIGPLGLKSFRFGPSNQPADEMVWGHEGRRFGRSKAAPPINHSAEQKPFGSPAGFLHASLPDLLQYVKVHIDGANGNGTALRPESHHLLYQPTTNQHYALGWEVEEKRDSSGKIVERSIYHGGYTGRFRANLWFCPESQWGAAIVCNDGQGEGKEMAEVFIALLKEFGLIPSSKN